MDIPVPGERKGASPLLWIVILVLVGFGAMYLYTASTGTQTATTQAHCPGVDLQQEAFLLAQQAEQTRKISPFAGNYANAWFEVCFTNGKPLIDGVRPIRGFYDEEHPEDSWKTHSEQGVYLGFFTPKLKALKLDAQQVVAIDVVIFSQVKVCPRVPQA